MPPISISLQPSPRMVPPKYSDRKSTRLNSSHSQISYAVFCLKKKKTNVTSCPKFTNKNKFCHPRVHFITLISHDQHHGLPRFYDITVTSCSVTTHLMYLLSP